MGTPMSHKMSELFPRKTASSEKGEDALGGGTSIWHRFSVLLYFISTPDGALFVESVLSWLGKEGRVANLITKQKRPKNTF